MSVSEGELGGVVDLVLWTAWACGSRSNAYMRAEHGKLTRGTRNFYPVSASISG